MKQDMPLGVPRFLSKRFQNLYTYVWGKLYSESYLKRNLFNIKDAEARKKRHEELRELAREVQWMVFIFLVHRFLENGTIAAEQALQTLRDIKGIKSFRIGNKRFAKGSPAVMEGRRLAKSLMKEVKSKKMKRLILRANSTTDIIYPYRHWLYRKNQEYFFNQAEVKDGLRTFFSSQTKTLNSFGRTVNQTVEAFVFAEIMKLYENAGWRVDIKNPKDKKTKREVFRLKFSTRGKPNGYSYAIASKDGTRIQIRHGLRVAIENGGVATSANMCCDIAVIENHELKYFVTDQSIPNEWLLTFAEVKHMSAYPELIASFIGLVHELLPKRLESLRTTAATNSAHPSPFLYVSGILWAGALTMEETIVNRAYDLDIYHNDRPIGSPRILEEFDENVLLEELTDDLPF
jgi:hypothetical protein